MVLELIKGAVSVLTEWKFQILIVKIDANVILRIVLRVLIVPVSIHHEFKSQ